MQSCLYQGVVTHFRRTPVNHLLRYPVAMAYVDLDESETLHSSGLLPQTVLSLGSFRESDHAMGRTGGLSDNLRDFVWTTSGVRLTGPIRLLTQLRVLGAYFSPLNLYYCFSPHDDRIDAIVTEVSNTPWNEKHHYVLSGENMLSSQRNRATYRHAKQFHVSPFMPMDLDYQWRMTPPSENLSVRIDLKREDRTLFTAAMRLQRLALTRNNIRKLAVRMPIAPLNILAGIYSHAFKLWWKQCPFFPHPKKTSEPQS